MSKGARKLALSFVLVVGRGSHSRGPSASASSSAPSSASSSARAAVPPSPSGPTPAPSEGPAVPEPELAGAGEASDDFIEVPTLTPDVAPEPADGGSAPAKCPDGLWSRTPLEKLERLARAGDPCAKAVLVSRLLGGRPTGAAFRRALRLASEAEDAGATTQSCFLFDFAKDDARFARCVERSGERRRLSVLYISGIGVRRDLDAAEALINKEESQDCGTGQLQGIVDAERQRPTKRRYEYCRDGACTTLDTMGCDGERATRYRWKSAALRDQLTEAAGSRRAELARVLADFAAFVEQDSWQVYWHIDGSLRNSMSAGVELDLNQRFDALLENVVIRHALPTASDADVKTLRARVDDKDAELLRDRPRLYPDSTSKFLAAYRSAQRNYRKLEQSFVAFAGPLLGPDGERAARAALLRLRAETLERWSQV